MPLIFPIPCMSLSGISLNSTLFLKASLHLQLRGMISSFGFAYIFFWYSLHIHANYISMYIFRYCVWIFFFLSEDWHLALCIKFMASSYLVTPNYHILNYKLLSYHHSVSPFCCFPWSNLASPDIWHILFIFVLSTSPNTQSVVIII